MTTIDPIDNMNNLLARISEAPRFVVGQYDDFQQAVTEAYPDTLIEFLYELRDRSDEVAQWGLRVVEDEIAHRML